MSGSGNFDASFDENRKVAEMGGYRDPKSTFFTDVKARHRASPRRREPNSSLGLLLSRTMSFLLNENNNGRRQVSQVSNDEWRAALQQQIEEKRQREQQQKRFRGFEDDRPQQHQQQLSTSKPQHESHEAGYEQHNNSAWDANESQDPQCQQQMPGDKSSKMARPGRRGVHQMSNDAWREALEQQIREKKEREQQPQSQSGGGGAHRRRSQSAPGQDQEGSLPGPEPQLQQQHDQERARTTPSGSNNADLHAGSHGRKRVGMQTQEEFAKSLQEQLEVQKRFEQEALEFKRAQRQQRRKILIDDEPESKDASVPVLPAPVSTVKVLEAKPQTVCGDAELIRPPKQAKTIEEATSEHAKSEPHASDPNNQTEERDHAISDPKMTDSGIVPTVDPVALAKIVDFCEELKRQNEEVKQQLVEQHSVLASLRSSLIEAKAQSKSTKQPGATAKAAKQEPSGVKKPRQAAHGTPQRERVSSSSPAHAEEKAKKKAGTHHESSKRTERSEKTVDSTVRPPVVRSRPIRGESKIPFPSGVARAPSAPGSVDAKAPEVAEPKDDSEQMQQAVLPADEALKDTAPPSEDVEPEAGDASLADSLERDHSTETSRVSENGDGEEGTLGEERELRDDKEHAPAKPHYVLNTEDREEVAEMKPQVNRIESKLKQPEEHEDDADEELQLIHADSFLIIDDEAELLDVEDELPMGCESKLVRCEASPRHAGDDEGEIKSLSSFVLLDGASSLVALDQSLGDLFYR